MTQQVKVEVNTWPLAIALCFFGWVFAMSVEYVVHVVYPEKFAAYEAREELND